jgi:hypothetical protein
MAFLLGRVLVGFLLVGSVRLLLRVGPVLALLAAGIALWPSVAVAVALRRGAVPRAEARWPAWRPHLWLPCAALGLVLAVGLLPEDARRAVYDRYGVGILAPAAVALGVLAPGPALRLRGAAVPAWLAGGVLLAAGWPVYGWFVRRARPWGQESRAGGRTPADKPFAPAVPPPPKRLRLHRVSAQAIATGAHAGVPWLVTGWLARGILTLITADAKCGKTELVFGLIRAAFDRRDFCGLPTVPLRVLILTEQNEATLYPFVRRHGFYTVPRSRLHGLRLRWLPRRGEAGHAVDVVTWGSLYKGRAPGDRPAWTDVAPAGIALALRGRYDLLVVDTLGRWITGEGGSENSNSGMLQATGWLHDAADKGLAVLVNHHNSRAGRARGATAIEGDMDILLSVQRAPGKGEDEEATARRVVRGKGRFAEDTPAALYCRLVPTAAPRPVAGPTVRFVADPDGVTSAGATVPPPAEVEALAAAAEAAPPPPPKKDREAEFWAPGAPAPLVMAALAGRELTARELGERVGEPLASSPRRRQTIHECLGKLRVRGAVRVTGKQEAGPEGGKPAERFAVCPPPWTPQP